MWIYLALSQRAEPGPMEGNDVYFWLTLRKNSYCPKVVTHTSGGGEVAVRASDLGLHLPPVFQGDSGTTHG